jgi:hypothetical protein
MPTSDRYQPIKKASKKLSAKPPAIPNGLNNTAATAKARQAANRKAAAHQPKAKALPASTAQAR